MTRSAAPASLSRGAAAFGLVATVKAPAEQLLAFLTWHFDQGAAHISLYFDEPEDPAREICRRLAGPRELSLIACDGAHWARLKGRPDRHQNRQSKNAAHAYRASRLDWLGHIDGDEFLLASPAPGQILGQLPQDQILCRAEPFEALHDPGLADDIFTARQFRGALKARHAALRSLVMGPYAAYLPEAMLSHSVGKAFFRCGIPGLSPRLHGAFMAGERLPGPPFQPGLQLLHFHAQDRAAWLRALPFRLTRGAYQYHPQLQLFLSSASPEEMAAFYDETQILTPQKARALREAGRLVETDLRLTARIATWKRGEGQ